MTNAISAHGLALIQEFEGFQAEPKQLPTGGWVVGYSHVRVTEPGEAVNENDAVELLTSDLAPFENLVNTLVTQPLTQTQFDALVSFAFSVGAEAFGRSQVLRRINAADYVSAACAMDAWRKSDVSGELVIIDALVRRRTAEKALFLKELPQVAAPSVFRPSAIGSRRLDPRRASDLHRHARKSGSIAAGACQAGAGASVWLKS
jgi:lysozyme